MDPQVFVEISEMKDDTRFIEWHIILLKFSNGRKGEDLFSSSMKTLEGSKDLMNKSQFECLNFRFLLVVRLLHYVSSRRFLLYSSSWVCQAPWVFVRKSGSLAGQKKALNLSLVLLQTYCGPSLCFKITNQMQ